MAIARQYKRIRDEMACHSRLNPQRVPWPLRKSSQTTEIPQIIYNLHSRKEFKLSGFLSLPIQQLNLFLFLEIKQPVMLHSVSKRWIRTNILSSSIKMFWTWVLFWPLLVDADRKVREGKNTQSRNNVPFNSFEWSGCDIIWILAKHGAMYSRDSLPPKETLALTGEGSSLLSQSRTKDLPLYLTGLGEILRCFKPDLRNLGPVT